jgi:protein involved in sex pheromone biosynthesis
MKKVLALAFVATMVVLSACGGSKSEAAADSVTVDSTVAAQADSIATDSVAADSAVAK